MLFRNNTIDMGSIEGISEYENSITDENRVRAIIDILKQL